MIPLANKDNVNNSDPFYPFGKSVDDTGSDNGTRVNFERLNDAEQFFEKMFSESGLAANNQPDNDNNGFQLYEAFRKLTRTYRVFTVRLEQVGTNAPTVADEFQNELNIVAGDFVYIGVGQYEIQKTGAFPAAKTAIFMNPESGINIQVRAVRIDADTISLSSAAALSPSNGALSSTLEIRVYD